MHTLAASGLLKWVFAMVNYYGVAKGVEPKRKKVGRPPPPAAARRRMLHARLLDPASAAELATPIAARRNASGRRGLAQFESG